MTKQSGLVYVGMDVGYGELKAEALIRRCRYQVSFPATLGKGRKISYGATELSARYPGQQLTDEDGLWFVGNLARSQLIDGEQQILRGRTVDEAIFATPFRRRLFRSAMAQLLAAAGVSGPVRVAVVSGLPVDHLDDAEYLRAAFSGPHHLVTDVLETDVDVVEVVVVPQPFGGVCSVTLTERGEVNLAHVAKRTGMCDVGTYTVETETPGSQAQLFEADVLRRQAKMMSRKW